MPKRYVIEIYLPLYDNEGKRFSRRIFDETRAELVELFGGMTAFTRSPATGLWKKTGRRVPVRDDLVIFEVIAQRLDLRWWAKHRRKLEARFLQEELVVRAHRVQML